MKPLLSALFTVFAIGILLTSGYVFAQSGDCPAGLITVEKSNGMTTCSPARALPGAIKASEGSGSIIENCPCWDRMEFLDRLETCDLITVVNSTVDGVYIPNRVECRKLEEWGGFGHPVAVYTGVTSSIYRTSFELALCRTGGLEQVFFKLHWQPIANQFDDITIDQGEVCAADVIWAACALTPFNGPVCGGYWNNNP
jgi:hypothetical protein